MKIGIIADTHDNITKTQKAVELFNKCNVLKIIHAGDIISPFTAKLFSGFTKDFFAVYGNNDGDKEVLRRLISKFGIIKMPPMFLDIDKISLCVLHEPNLINHLCKMPSVDVIIYGHIHRTSVIKDKCLSINPGECCGYITGRSTVAILDTATLNVEILEI
jgi:uncharacterized protein